MIKKCSNCGLINGPEAAVCERCEKVLVAEEHYVALTQSVIQEPMQTADAPAPAIGGWLILIGIGLFLGPIRTALYIQKDILPSFSGRAWTLLTTPSSEIYHPLNASYLIWQLVANSFFVIAATLLLVLFLGKRRIFPKLMMIYIVVNLIFVSFDYYLGRQIPLIAAHEDGESVALIIRGALQCVIWIPYFLNSDRVERTFIK